MIHHASLSDFVANQSVAKKLLVIRSGSQVKHHGKIFYLKARVNSTRILEFLAGIFRGEAAFNAPPNNPENDSDS
jgi:hypothetical protein